VQVLGERRLVGERREQRLAAGGALRVFDATSAAAGRCSDLNTI